MKVNLTKSLDHSIKGYENILYLPNYVDLNSVTDNEAELIIANEILDYFSIDKIPELIKLLISKLRLNGSLIIGGTEISVFCKSVINGMLDEREASKYIEQNQSMTDMNNILNLLQSFNLKIQTFKFSGLIYEITTIRN